MADKILLIRPRNIYNYNNYPPLNLISLGTSLKAAGYEVKIINCAFEKDPLRRIAEEKDILFAGFSLLTSEAPDAYALMKFIREQCRFPIVAGGWHCTLFPEQMSRSGLVDYVVAGEGEEDIVRIAALVKDGRGGAPQVYPKKVLDLEGLPCPDYGLDPSIERFVSGYLTDKLSERVRKPMRWLPYESSRGCPSRCTFCINVVTGNMRYRKKSAAKVLAEIDRIVRAHKLTHLKFVDDNFFVDIERVRRIADGIIEKGLDITWDAECRCDYFNDRMLNDETLALCKRAGLVQLTLGVESGSPRTLRIMKKGITPEQAEQAVRKCDEHGIIARSSFILEIPGEDISDIRQTVRLINRLRRYDSFTCGVGTFRPYPKCELTERLILEGFLKEPRDFAEWTSRETVDMYTSAEHIRPWQVNGRYSESAAFYLNMESCIRLGSHQIEGWLDRVKNALFVFFAKIRNRCAFYALPYDKELYKKFLVGFYARKQQAEQGGSYPLADPHESNA